MKIGALTGPYRLLRHLGSGGMGEVWLAEDTRLDRQVALKMVRADGDATSRSRLMKEARAAAALNHPHIATVHDVLEHEGEIIVVFEYVEGETLQARIARGPLPAPEAVEIAMQIAKALVGAHANGVIHRDLKPANVIIGAGGHVKVLDFGIARMLSRGTTQTNPAAQPQTASGLGFIGTASYAAPEQMVSSAVDERADLYALGVVLFEMISGKRPFVGSDPVQLATKKLGTDAPKLSSTGRLVPPELESIVAGLLEREPEKRPESAADVLGRLKHVFGGDSTVFLPRRRSRSPVFAIAASALIVLLGGFGAWRFMGTREATPRPGAPPVIAVLPLANVSGDPSRDFVAAGIAESLIASLATIPSVTVLSRTSVIEAKNRTKDTAALTKDLGVNYVVEGSVQESSGKLKVDLTLVKADRSVAWGDSIVGTFEQIFDLQSRLASALTSALVVRVSASELEKMKQQPTSNPLALSAYWRGRALMERGDVPGNRDAAIASFVDATRLDPNFAVAYAALGRVYWDKYTETKEADWTTKALDAGATALRLNSSLPEVRFAMATVLSGTGRLDDAVQELTNALAVQPNYDDARRMLGQILARQGKLDAAIAEYRKAVALRPTYWLTYSSLGNTFLSAARYDEAIDAFRMVTTLQPDNWIGYQQLGTAYQTIGNRDQALANYERATAIRPNPQAYSNIGTLEYERGNYDEAAAAYRAAIKLRPNAAATHRNLGDTLRRLKRTDDARASYLEAVRLAEVDLRVNPNDSRTRASLAIYLSKAAQPEAARRHLGEALQRGADDVEVLFRSAVAEAVLNQPAAALEHLQKASKLGYSSSSIASTDEFESLRNLPEFQQLIKKPRP